MNSNSLNEKINIECLNTVVKTEPVDDEEIADYINLTDNVNSKARLQSENIKNRKIDKKHIERTYRSSRLASKATNTTTEVNNIYAKPRMHFTGRGIITKSQGCNIISKSKKEKKTKSKLKIKEENLDFEPAVLQFEAENIVISDDKFDNYGFKEDNYHEISCNVNSEIHFDNNKSEEVEKLTHNCKNEVEESIQNKNNDTKGEEQTGFHKNAYIKQEEEDDLPIKYFPSRKMFKRVGHTSDNTVECTVCFKQIKEPSMKQHFKTHSGVKPFQCTHCGARFTRKGDVLRHRKTIHQSIRPYQCIMCDRQFVERKNLMFHLENHDKTLYYTCKTCGFKFGKKEYYENHIMYMHPLLVGETIADISEIAKKGSKQLEELQAEENREIALGKKSVPQISMTLSDVEAEDVDSPEEVKNYARCKEEEVDNEECIFFADDSPSKHDGSSYNSSLCSVEYEEGSDDSGDGSESTEVYVEKGTLNLTQKISSTVNLESQEDEELVNQAINATVSQAESAIETIQSSSGNLTSSKFSMYCKSLKCDQPESQTKCSTKKAQPNPEIHINASVGGQLRKFIIQIPTGCNIDPTTPDGMDAIVKMVNYLCAGKGELNGAIEVTMHHDV